MRNLFNGRCLVCLLATLISCTAGADGHQVAAVETAKALSLTPDMENGRKLYGICAVCHNPEGWGSENGYYPQIAGQLSGVIIKQLADIRVRNVTRDTPFKNAKSMLEVMSLAVKQGHLIELKAEGEDAAEAIEALRELIDSNFGE